MEILEKNKDEIKIEINENAIKLADSIVYLTNQVEILDMEVKNTQVDDIVANLYKEYAIS